MNKSNSKRENNELIKISCIFKTKDDIRHDTLTLKFILLMKEMFKWEKVELFLKAYNTFSIRSSSDNSLGGLIEVLKDAKSINEISKWYDNKLYDYFRNKYGDENSWLYKIV